MASNQIRVLGGLNLTAGLIFETDYNGFPANPAPRTIIVQQGTPYIYTELNYGSNYWTWQPIGTAQSAYLHTQGVASNTWTVTHDLGSSDLGFFVYDANHNLQVANIEIVNNNTARVLLTEAITGTAVFFSTRKLSVNTVNASNTVVIGGLTVANTDNRLSVNGGTLAYQTDLLSLTNTVSTLSSNVAQISPAMLEVLNNITGVDGNGNTYVDLGAISYANSAFNVANSAFAAANNVAPQIAPAFTKANSAYDQANTATTNAATADSKAVTAGYYANSAYTAANTADSKAVTAGSYANSAYGQANTATTNAATADSKAVTAGSYANSAYAAANVGNTFVTSGGTIGGTVTVNGNILPKTSNTTNIGSPTLKFASIYANDLHLGANTLYVDGSPVLGSSAENITFTANTNQGIQLQTYGTGNITLTSNSTTRIQTTGQNGDVIVEASGLGSLARITSNTQVTLTAPTVQISGNQTVTGDATITGNLTINGTTTTVHTTNLNVDDNIIDLNKGESGSGVSRTYSGFQVIRGDQPNVRVVWNETNGTFVMGPTGSEVNIASTPQLNVVFTQANSAFTAANTADSKAVTAGSYANSAYAQANTATTNAATADSKAVTAGSYANSAFAAANTADSKAVTAGSYANSAYAQANTATTNAATADSKAVTAGSYANSAFAAANTATTNSLAKSGGVVTGAISSNSPIYASALSSNTSVTINTSSYMTSTSYTTSTTSQVTAFSFAIATYRSAKILAQMTSGSSYHMIELNIIHDGTTAYVAQYGEVKSGSSLGTFDASITSGNLNVLFTPTNSTTTAKIVATLIAV